MADFIEVVRHSSNIVELRLKGEIQNDEAFELENSLHQLAEHGYAQFILDLKHVRHLTSSALSYLASFKSDLTSVHGDVKMVAPPPGVVQLFQITMLDHAFEVFENMNDAVSACRPSS